MAGRMITTGCYDLGRVTKFLRSVAMAISIQRNSGMRWTTYRESGVLNAIYTVMFWKEPPGAYEMTQDKASIEAETDMLFERYLMHWIKVLAEQGPGAANAYIGELGQARQHAMLAMDSMLRDANQVNAQIIGELNAGMRALETIKLGATIGVAGVAMTAGIGALLVTSELVGGATAIGITSHIGASSAAMAGTNFAYSAGSAVIKTWEELPRAMIAGVEHEVGKTAGGMAADWMGEHLISRMITSGARAQQIIQSAEGELLKYSEKLMIKGLQRAARRRAQSRIAQAGQQIATQSAMQARSGLTKAVGTGLAGTATVVFAAWDMIEGVSDYRGAMADLDRDDAINRQYAGH